MHGHKAPEASSGGSKPAGYCDVHVVHLQALSHKEPDSGFWSAIPARWWRLLGDVLQVKDLHVKNAKGELVRATVPVVPVGDLLEPRYQDEPHVTVRRSAVCDCLRNLVRRSLCMSADVQSSAVVSAFCWTNAAMLAQCAVVLHQQQLQHHA